MSGQLIYEPKKPTPESRYLPDSLKYLFQEQIEMSGVTLTKDSIPYLTGMVDAGKKDAQKLITLLEKYDEIELSIIY